MSTRATCQPISIINYYDWAASQHFKDYEEELRYVSFEEKDFLQHVIYPMFYRHSIYDHYPLYYPYVVKTYSTKKPKYVIDNEYFTCVFFSYTTKDEESCWEVSFHIKDHNFCDIPIRDFKEWYKRNYYEPFLGSDGLKGMPKRFSFPDIDVYSQKVDDFCVEFSGSARDFMLFRLLDLVRIY